MIQSVQCVNSKRTNEAISCSICAVVQRNRIRLGTSVWVLAPICLDSSDRLLKLGEELHLHFDSAKRVAGSCSGIRHRTIPADWFGATVGRYFLHHVVNTC